jgi:methionyl aminopeptidase
MLSDEELAKYREAGRIVAEVREEIRPLIKAGAKLVEIAERAEELIRAKGARPAFPCNVSVNEIAAHYSPPLHDERTIQEGDLVKVDIGAHVDGRIADTAFTVSIGGETRLIEAAEAALEAAISVAKPGVDLGELGKAIEQAITQRGLKPVRNLTGHGLSAWDLHAGLTIPNVDERTGRTLRPGDVLAIEPFATDGAGYVEDTDQTLIFRYLRDAPTRLRMTRALLRDIKNQYRTLPFAERWLAKRMSRLRLELSLRELVGAGALWPYRVLVERAKGRVAQAEHTVVVTEDGCEVITR